MKILTGTYLIAYSFLGVFIDFSSNDKIKEIIFYSIVIDNGLFCRGSSSFEGFSNCAKNLYNNLEIEDTEVIEGEFSSKIRHTFYSLKSYKIKSYAGENTYYLIHYKDVESEAWYRIKGYKDNDFIHFYNRVLKKYYNDKKASQVIKKWQNQDSLLSEVDFDCLLNGVKKKRTKSDCFIAESLVFGRSLRISSDHDKEIQLYDNIYASFSRRPYSGTLPEL